MRFRDGERCYDIKALGDPEGDGRRLICLCEEVNP
jgi:head-tail adaptor